MNEALWVEVAKQAPSLGVLVWLVVHFLRHMKEYARHVEDLADKCHTSHKTIIDEAHSLQRETNRAMEQNAKAFGRNDAVLSRFTNGKAI